MPADFDAAVVAIGGFMALDACRTGVGEETLDFGAKCWPVVLEAEEIVGAPVANGFGDFGLAAHGVDGDQRAGQFEPLEKFLLHCPAAAFFRAFTAGIS